MTKRWPVRQRGLPGDTAGTHWSRQRLSMVTVAPRGSMTKTCRLSRLWRRIVRRVLKSPNADGIAYGYVGYYAE